MPTIPSHKTVRVEIAVNETEVLIPGSSSYTRFLICRTGCTAEAAQTVVANMGTGAEAAVAITGSGTNGLVASLNTPAAAGDVVAAQVIQVELMAPAIGGLKFNIAGNILVGALAVSMWGSVHSQGLR